MSTLQAVHGAAPDPPGVPHLRTCSPACASYWITGRVPALLTRRPVSLPTVGGSYPASPLPPGLRSVSSRKNDPVTHW
jgi:hypothetical protein